MRLLHENLHDTFFADFQPARIYGHNAHFFLAAFLLQYMLFSVLWLSATWACLYYICEGSNILVLEENSTCYMRLKQQRSA